MILDQVLLLTAIAFSSAALMVTLFTCWLGMRRDNYLLSWSVGLLLAVVGVVLFTIVYINFDSFLLLLSFVFTLSGIAVIHAGTLQFRKLPLSMGPFILLVIGLNGAMGFAFLAGFSGVGAIIGNLGMALFMALSGFQYWQGRNEAPLHMTANALIYGLVSISFVLCAVALTADHQWVLLGRPDNWAEDINAVVVIIGLTGIGAISLTLNQSRSTQHHQRKAMTDQLTGLLNRRALFETFATAPLEPGTTVIMFDIDHFKLINDRHGHAIGDVMLERFAEVMLEALGSQDSAVRLGGEEFCAVMRNRANYTSAAVAESIRAKFEATAVPSSHGVAQTTVSAGVAIAGIDGEPFEEVLRRADLALYKAKAAGRNRVHAPAPRLVA